MPPIHRKNLYSLQYSMLPARRAGVWDMWRALTTPTDGGKGLKTVYEGTGGRGLTGRRSGGLGRGRYGH